MRVARPGFVPTALPARPRQSHVKHVKHAVCLAPGGTAVAAGARVAAARTLWDAVWGALRGASAVVADDAGIGVLDAVVEGASVFSLEYGGGVRREKGEWMPLLVARGAALEGEMERLRVVWERGVSAEGRTAFGAQLAEVRRALAEVDHVVELLDARADDADDAVLALVGPEGGFSCQVAPGAAGLVEAPAEMGAEARDAEVRAMKAFVDHLIVPHAVCPYTASSDLAAVGAVLKRNGIAPGRVLYPVSCAARTEHVLRDFFAAANELLQTDDAATTLLAAPNFLPHDFPAFALFTTCLQDMLVRSGLDNDIGLVAFHPFYDRDAVEPRDGLINGHLPPASFLQSYLLKLDGPEAAAAVSAKELAGPANFARRSPQPMFNILRATHMRAITNDAMFPQEMVYTRNAKRLAEIGEDRLGALLRRIQRHRSQEEVQL